MPAPNRESFYLVSSLIPFVVIIIAFWFLLIRPQQKRARQTREMQNALSVGDKVMLTSGIYGDVAGITDDYVLVRIAEGVEVRAIRNAIGQVLPDETADGGPDDPDAATEPADEGAVDLSKPADSTVEPTDDSDVQRPTQSSAGPTDNTTPSETPEETLARLRKQGENQ